MKIVPVTAILLLSLSIGNLTKAQENPTIDSLRKALKTGISDKERVDIYNTIAYIQETDTISVAEQSEKAISLATKIGYLEGVSDAYYNLGWTAKITGKYPKSIEFFKQTLSFADQAGYKQGKANAFNGLGESYEAQGYYPLALEHHFKALKIREQMRDNRAMASSYNNIGNIYISLGDYPSALEQHFKALKIREKIGDKHSMANSYNNIGFIYYEEGDYPSALEYHFKSLKIVKDLDDKDWMALSYSSIGEVYLELKEYTKAFKYQQLSLDLYNEVNDQAYATYPLLGLGETYLAKKQYGQAIRYLEEATQTAQKLGKNDVARDGAEQLALAYEGAGRYKDAYISMRQFKNMADSLNNEEVTKKITAQSMQYEFDKKQAVAKAEAEKKALIHQQELERHSYYSKAAIGSGLAILIIAGVIFRSYRLKQRDNHLLAQQNEEIKQQSEEIAAQRDSIEVEKLRSEKLLLNILPKETAQELKNTGKASPKSYEKVTVLFTDFKGFTHIAEKMREEDVVANLDYCFKAFDRIIKKHNLEKIKTIGDAYMCAGGIPIPNDTNPIDAVLAAQEMIAFMHKWATKKEAKGELAWELRLGIHTGKVVAGVVGEDKFAYDIWGDAVNTASRMESSGAPNKINISGATYALVRNHFHCEYRGKVTAKNKGEVDMYFIESRYGS